jgi:hypothetical protein
MSKREGSNTRLRESSLTSSQNQIEILPIEIVLSTLTTHPATPKLYLLNAYITHNSSYTYKTADIRIQQLSRTHIAAHIHVQKKERNKKKKYVFYSYKIPPAAPKNASSKWDNHP